MNNTIEGWESGPSTHRFGGNYGIQRAWHRAKMNDAKIDSDGFIDVSDRLEQLGLPEEWIKKPAEFTNGLQSVCTRNPLAVRR